MQLLEPDYEILAASDGPIAQEMVERCPPDRILGDLSLPLIDVWEVTAQVKANPLSSEIRIIAVTGQTGKDAEKRAKACGRDDILTKPIDEDLVFPRGQHVLRKENG